MTTVNDYNLGREEAYEASANVWAFKNADDIVNGINLRLSNMCGGFPFEFCGRTFADSERLYLCGEWSNNTEEHRTIQEELMTAKSGYAAKRFVKSKYKNSVRADFATFRLQWMLFCVWTKCKGNADFRKLLMSLPKDAVLLENTTTDKWPSSVVWGSKNKELVDKRDELKRVLQEQHKDATKKSLDSLINVETNKINDIGVWRGQNCIGKILMICRDCIREEVEPQIDYTLLRSADIHLFGKLLTFED